MSNTMKEKAVIEGFTFTGDAPIEGDEGGKQEDPNMDTIAE